MKIRKLKKKSKILVRAKIIAQQVLNNTDEYRDLSIEDLKIRTDYLVKGLQEKKFELDDIVVDAFSIAREIIYREYGMLAYEVQMMGAYVVHCGDFAEMYTGEGKSLTILLVAFLNALEKQGVHIVTVNEYLVERDAEFARKAFEKLGITVGYNTSKLNKPVKKEMFAKDITYTTNSELGFDYLKDNMVRSMDEKVIRGLHFVIIDEGDSVLIDEARTPLIISGQPKEDYSLYLDIDSYVSSLVEEDYKIDNESNTISLTDSGVLKAEKFFKIDNLYSIESAEIVHKITNALVAHYIFANGKEYLVKDDKIYLVDQFTGRVLEGRSYNAGLQQAIQAKERVKIEPENVVMATITYQSFFRLYDKLSAVSGTAMTEAEEFLKIYNMVVVRIPTNRPIIRQDKQDYIFGTKKAKWNHVIAEIVNRHKTGQPILVGTASVTDSEIIHERLEKLNIPHEVLNARDNTKEAEIVKHGGEKGAITISTNMAGRGTDIKVDEEMKAIGGLYVIGTERHESRRIDNQLRGRTGRQGDPGESRFFISLEDSLFKRFATDKFAKASEKLEDEYYDSKFFSRMLDNTQKKVEGLNFDIRKNLMDYDHVLSLQRELIYKQRDQILLKTSNFEIVNNMINDYATIFINDFRNKENTALVDSKKITEFLNTEILKFDFFDATVFENQAILTSVEKFLMIIKNIIKVKYAILSELSATNVIDEILLVNLDQFWTRHIDKMTKLREGVNLRSLEQRSPLNIYIEDGNNLFEKMKSDIVNNVINQICHLSLPNEQEKIRESLQALVDSEEYKKKDIDNNNQTEPVSSTVNDDEFADINEPNKEQNVVYNKDSFKQQPSKVDEFEKEIKAVEKEIDNTTYAQNVDEYVDLDTLIDDTQAKYEKPDEVEDETLEIKSDELFNQENAENWVETDEIVTDGEKLETNEVIVQNNAGESNLDEFDDILVDDITPEANITPQDETRFLAPIENIEAPIQAQVEKLDDIEEVEVDIDDSELESILNMPAFKDGESNISLSQYLDNVLANLNLVSEDEINAYQNQLNDIEQPEIKTTFDKTLSQQKQEELQEIRDEVKNVITTSKFNNEDFIKYKQGFFVDQNNTIDYSESAKNYLAKNKEPEEVGVIKQFYKTPVVERRKPGTLFGMPLSKYDKPLPKDATIEDYIKSKEANAATQEQLNNLLFVDDELARLQKIDNKYKDKNKDLLIQRKLARQIENEQPNIEIPNELENDVILDDFQYCEHPETLYDEDPQVISSILTSKNPEIPINNLENHVITNYDYPTEFDTEQTYHVDNLTPIANNEVVEQQYLDETYQTDQIYQESQEWSSDQELLQMGSEEDVNKTFFESNEEILNATDEAVIDDYINENFIKKFTFKKYVEDKYESEIIKEIREKNTQVVQEPIHNLDKDIIEILEKRNSIPQK